MRLAQPSALDFFGTLVAEDQGLPLTEAAIALAQDEYPALDVQGVLAQIDDLVERMRRRIPVDAVPLQKLRFLNRFFFQELGFAGNVNDYYDPDNSYLHRVLETRRGIPISLAVLYMELASQLGLPARGVSFPGHFLVKLRMQTDEQRGEVVIDPFTGLSLSRDELTQRLGPYKRRQGLVGDFDAPLGLFLQSASSRDVLSRMLRNLKEIHRNAEDWERLLQVQRRLVTLLPADWEEVRDRGLARAELRDWARAAEDLQTYLSHAPQGADVLAMRARLAELRAHGSSGSLH
jgi:regulator of sirC expression with transglutaminase-like and TPR domain